MRFLLTKTNIFSVILVESTNKSISGIGIQCIGKRQAYQQEHLIYEETYTVQGITENHPVNRQKSMATYPCIFLRKTVNTVNILKAMFRFGVVRFGVFTDVIFEELMLTNKVGKLENFSTILKLNPKAN